MVHFGCRFHLVEFAFRVVCHYGNVVEVAAEPADADYSDGVLVGAYHLENVLVGLLGIHVFAERLAVGDILHHVFHRA